MSTKQKWMVFGMLVFALVFGWWFHGRFDTVNDDEFMLQVMEYAVKNPERVKGVVSRARQETGRQDPFPIPSSTQTK